MAVLHLQFDIDSAVYPELHDLLEAIDSVVSREERLRQLAAIGLIWERTRLQAQAGMLDAVSSPLAPVVPPPAAPAPAAASPRQLPVLTDVVDPTEFPGSNPAAAALHGAADASRIGANDPVHDVPAARRTAHHSRLMRMKERGLFKNE
jgi:hypothetical protein